MKKYKRILTILISVLIMIQSIMFNTQVAYAKEHEEGDNVVYKVSVTGDEFLFDYTPPAGLYKYKVDDSTGIPTGSTVNSMCYFKYGDNDKFGAIQSSQFVTLIVNKGLGLVMSDDKLAAFYTSYLSAISGTSHMSQLLDSNNNVLGYVLNDISGCVYDAAPNKTDITIPSTETNNVYNYYQYYIDVVSPETPDYINVQTYNLNTVSQQLDVTNQYTQSSKAIINDVGNGLCCYYYYSVSGQTIYKRLERSPSATNGSGSYGQIDYYDLSGSTLYANGTQSYNQFCSDYGLKQNGQQVGYTALINGSNNALIVKAYDVDNSIFLNSCTRYTGNINAATYTTSTQSVSNFTLCRGHLIPCTKDAKLLTVYKDTGILTSVVNKTYAPSTFTSTTYNNYNTNSDNSISTNTSVVNNSQETNNSIYNDASESFSEYYSSQDNYNIDNSVTIENTTEIIYNYYGDDSGGGEGGGGSDDDNDLIWNAMLKAIVDFFKKLGELIAALITGILGLFTQVLDALAQITTSFTSLTNFFASILGFLPNEMITVLTAALGLVLLCCVIRIFRR